MNRWATLKCPYWGKDATVRGHLCITTRALAPGKKPSQFSEPRSGGRASGAPSGLTVAIMANSQGLTPLAIVCRRFAAENTSHGPPPFFAAHFLTALSQTASPCTNRGLRASFESCTVAGHPRGENRSRTLLPDIVAMQSARSYRSSH